MVLKVREVDLCLSFCADLFTYPLAVILMKYAYSEIHTGLGKPFTVCCVLILYDEWGQFSKLNLSDKGVGAMRNILMSSLVHLLITR